jgi:hypothetical protein
MTAALSSKAPFSFARCERPLAIDESSLGPYVTGVKGGIDAHVLAFDIELS